MTTEERAHLNQLTHRVYSLEQQVQFLARHLGVTLDELPSLDEVGELLRRGDKLEAIERYREMTGADLATAKAAVDELAAKLGYV